MTTQTDLNVGGHEVVRDERVKERISNRCSRFRSLTRSSRSGIGCNGC